MRSVVMAYHTPESDAGSPFLAYITGAVGGVLIAQEVCPVMLKDILNLVWQYARHVVPSAASTSANGNQRKGVDAHDCEYAALCLGGVAHPIPNLIPQIPHGKITQLDLALTCEPLQKRPIHAVAGHPMKVALHAPRVARRKEVYGVAQGGGKARCGVEFGGVIFGGVGPEVDVGAAASCDGEVEPMEPAVVTWLS